MHGELNCIREQIQKNLAQPALVAAHESSGAGGNWKNQIQAFAASLGCDDFSAVLDYGVEREIGIFQFELTSLDFGEIKDVINNGQQRLAGVPDRQTYSLCSGERVVSKRRSVIPITPFIGVRISWLMVARKSDFAVFAWSAASCLPDKFFNLLAVRDVGMRLGQFTAERLQLLERA